DRVDGIRIMGFAFEREEALLDGGQMLTGFEDEIGDEFRVLGQRVGGLRPFRRRRRGCGVARAVRESLLKPGKPLLELSYHGWPGGKFAGDAGCFDIAGVARLPAKFRERGQESLRATARGSWARVPDQQSSGEIIDSLPQKR